MSDRLREEVVPNPSRKDLPYFSGDLIRSNGVHALNTGQHHSMRLQTLDRDNFHPSVSQHHLGSAEGQHGRTEPAQDEIQLGRRGGSFGNDFQLGAAMPKNSASRSASARKSTSRARLAKKKMRRVIFKADEWYATAAMSIGIAGRAKGSRQVSTF